MSKHIVRGFVGFSKLLRRWLEEAEDKGMLKDGLNLKEIANFVVISLNGAAALHAATGDPLILGQTVTQLQVYINQLRK